MYKAHMIRVDLKTALAFNRLKSNELSPIVDLLREEGEAARNRMVSCTEEWQWRQAQGRAQLTDELLKLVEESSTLAEKLKPASR